MSGKRAGQAPSVMEAFRPVISVIQIVTGPWTRENGISWIRLIVFVLTVWWLFIQPFRIPSQSMYPTLNGDPGFFTGDRVFVNKLAFGPRIPFSTTRIFNWGHPKRFDVVVFRAIDDDSPRDTAFQRAINFFLPKVLIKRVIGLPGERVRIEDGSIYINDSTTPLELPESMKAIHVRYTNEAPAEMKMPIEQIESMIRQQGGNDGDVNYARDQYAKYRSEKKVMKYGCLPDDEFSVVPAGHYLMLGDNSASSYDSRYWGWVPEDWIFGRAFCVWWPIAHRKDLSGFTDTWWGLLLLLGIPGLLLLYEFVVRPFCVVSLRVRGQGMSGALRRGDRILINRLAFGFRRPFSDQRITTGRAVQRGELVAYFVPHGDGVDYAGEALLGRVAALPGDSYAVDAGVITVNDQPTDVRWDGSDKSGMIKIKKSGSVPQNRYLLLTDSDDSAPDSRTVGFIPRELLIGPATHVWWPPYRWRSLASK